MKVIVTQYQEVTLDDAAVQQVFRGELDSLCGGADTYLEKGVVKEWEDTGHGSGITRTAFAEPSDIMVAALKLRELLDDERRKKVLAEMLR